jgi:hypothetical protein
MTGAATTGMSTVQIIEAVKAWARLLSNLGMGRRYER